MHTDVPAMDSRGSKVQTLMDLEDYSLRSADPATTATDSSRTTTARQGSATLSKTDVGTSHQNRRTSNDAASEKLLRR